MRANKFTYSINTEVWNNLWAKQNWRLDCEQISRQQLVLSWIRNFNGKRIIELGAGTGLDSLYFKEKYADTVCLDYSQNSLKLIRINFKENKKSAKLIQGDIRYLPIANEVMDIVYSSGVLEHYPEPTPLINEMVRITKKGGIIICFVPQTFAWWTIKKNRLMAKNKWFAGWENNYSYFSLKGIFKRNDLKLIHIKGLHINLTPWYLYGKYYFWGKRGWLFRFIDKTYITNFFGKAIGIMVEKI